MKTQTRKKTSTSYSGSWNYGSKSCKTNKNLLWSYFYICRYV